MTGPYDSLQPGEIRLLRLFPGLGSDQLVCRLETVPLQLPCRIRYEALSYVWGDPDGVYNIHLLKSAQYGIPNTTASQPEDVDKIGIRANLRDALFHLRLRDATRLLWVDALCINQDNTPERGSQVQMMGQIYLSAEQVVVWLGNEDERTVESIQFVKKVSSWRFIHPLGFKAKVIPKEGTRRWHFEPGTPGDVDPDLWDAFESLLSRAWFKRGWVFQESVLARRLNFRIGDLELDWNEFEDSCEVCWTLDRFYGGGNFKGLDMEKEDYPYDRVLEIARFRKAVSKYINPTTQQPGRQEARNILSLENLLCARRYDKVTDFRDKVFCLLWFADRQALDQGGAILLPDYSLTVAEVYTKTVVKLAQQDTKDGTIGNLKFLNWIDDTNPDHGLPSWVPDWSMACRVHPISGEKPLCPWDATKGSKVRASFMYGNPRASVPAGLVARGVRLMVIKELGSVFTKVQTSGGQHALENARMLDQFPNRYPTIDIEYTDAYGLAMNPTSPEHTVHNSHRNFWEFTLACERGTEKLQRPTDRGRYVFHSEFHSRHLFFPTVGKRFLNIGRRFFVSMFGFAGLAPRQAQPGDEICILFGCNVPLAIRQNGRHYTFVGECSVLGLMKGESMDGLPLDRIEDLVFT